MYCDLQQSMGWDAGHVCTSANVSCVTEDSAYWGVGGSDESCLPFSSSLPCSLLPPSHPFPLSLAPSLPPTLSLSPFLPPSPSLYLDPLSLNNPSYTVLTPPEALNLSATVNFNVIQSVVWRRDGQVVNSVDNSVGVFARLSTADLFGNYTVTAISRQGVVYEEWALVAAYGMHEHYICTYIRTYPHAVAPCC